MIIKLTKKQEKELVKFTTESLRFGRSIKPINHRKCESIINKFYKRIGEEKPKYIYLRSPYECMMYLVNNNLGSNLGSNLESNLGSNLGSNLESNLESNLRSNLESNLRSNLWSNLRSNLESNLESNLRSNLRSNLWSNLRSNLWSNLRSNLRSNLWSNLRSNLFCSYFAGQQWLYWTHFYKFCESIGCKYSKSDSELLNEWFEEGRNLHWWFPFKGTVLISERPIRQNLNSNGQLHDFNQKAIEYADGWGCYYANGIKMEEKYILTPAKDLKSEDILKEPNVDVRRELIRKVGIQNIVSSLPNKTLDKKDNYELISIDFKDLAQDCRFLKMKNPSLIETWHLEGVDRLCNSVQDALNWRGQKLLKDNKENWQPVQLT